MTAPPDPPLPDLADVVRAWVDGWVVSRNTSRPVAVPGGFRIDVGLPGHVCRYVLPRADPAVLRGLRDTVTLPATWLKVCAPRDVVEPLLSPAWVVKDPEFLMTAPLHAAHVAPPAGYALDVATRDGTTQVRVIARGGEVAASGRIGRSGAAAVVDQVSTDPAHRRRGLGTLLMTALADAAAAEGAVAGVLVATSDGLALYQAIGWTLRAPVTAAVLEGTAA